MVLEGAFHVGAIPARNQTEIFKDLNQAHTSILETHRDLPIGATVFGLREIDARG